MRTARFATAFLVLGLVGCERGQERQSSSEPRGRYEDGTAGKESGKLAGPAAGTSIGVADATTVEEFRQRAAALSRRYDEQLGEIRSYMKSHTDKISNLQETAAQQASRLLDEVNERVEGVRAKGGEIIPQVRQQTAQQLNEIDAKLTTLSRQLGLTKEEESTTENPPRE